MEVVEYHRNHYTISTDTTKLNRALIHSFLDQASYWAQGRSVAVVEKSMKHSLCFGVYANAEQVGFARLVTDYATFAPREGSMARRATAPVADWNSVTVST